ncbi:uncharacterized protein ARMOST_03404 [Armillaria ostoyae]|uniref:Uncharacterized protein n=1 Tax=Armillaria ostoyae TaxID=47428 RepID=A0A284QUG0_ARMOS|nr:uncharacterized protein ARMOST_03404 [Armillaria ostoyae]
MRLHFVCTINSTPASSPITRRVAGHRFRPSPAQPARVREPVICFLTWRARLGPSRRNVHISYLDPILPLKS